MSYCRWSSSNWRCDLYIYESDSGWMIHVARNRIVGRVPDIVWPVDKSPEAVERFAVTHKAQMDFIATADRKPIGLPHDGETFCASSASECADLVELLIRTGYHAPASVVMTLREEAAE
jgi:hypothetical protein